MPGCLRPLKFLIALVGAITVAAQAASGAAAQAAPPDGDGPAARPASPSAPPAGARPAAEYRIGPGDTLHIFVYQNPDLTLDARVTDAGVISYPLIGETRLAGLSTHEAEMRIAGALRQGDFVRNPAVNVTVTQVRANQVNVLGQVGRPGRYPLDLAGMRLTEVLALAGGVVPGVGSDTLVVVGRRDGHPFRQEIDLPTLFSAGHAASDLVMQPGDTVWVDRAPQIYLYGEIQHPGILRLEPHMTVMQALAAGGGVTPRGTVRGLRVTRREADGQVRSFEPSMQDELAAGDVMFVRESLF